MSLKSIGQIKGFIDGTSASLSKLSIESVSAASSLLGLSANEIAATSSTAGLTAAETAAILAQKNFSRETARQAMILAGYSPEAVEAALATQGFVVSEVAATGATSGLTAAVKGLNTAIKANPFLFIASIVLALLPKIIELVKGLHESTEDLVKAGDEAFESVTDKVNKLTKQAKAMDELAESYANLSQGVDKLTNKNIALSDEDYKEYLSVSNELAELFPDLIHGTDEYGNYILDLNGNYEKINETLRENLSLEQERAAVTARNNGDDIFRAGRAQVRDAQNDIKQVEAELENYQSTLEYISSQNYLDYITAIGNPDVYVFDTHFDSASSARAWLNQQIGDLKKEISVYEQDIDDAWSNLRSTLKTSILDNDVYRVMSDEQRSMIQRVIDSLDYTDLDFSGWNDAYNYIVSKVLPAIAGNDEFEGVEIPFNLITELNGNKISVGAYRKQILDFLNQLNDLVSAGVLDDGIVVAIRTIFDVDDDFGVPNTAAIAQNISERLNSHIDLNYNPNEWIQQFTRIQAVLDEMSYSELQDFIAFISTCDLSNFASMSELMAAFAENQASIAGGVEKLADNYEDLSSAADNLSKAQKGLIGSFENGASITKDTYDAVAALVGGEEMLAGVIDTTNGYVIRDADALARLTAEAEDALNTNVKLAASHEKLKYHKLVKELKAVTTSTKTYDGVVKKVIQSIRNEMNAVDLQIQKYQLLEQQLLGVTNAFSRFSDAQEIDKAADYTDDFGSMLSSLLADFKNGTYGTESFRAAFEGLIPENIYGQFTDAGDQIEAGWKYISRTLNSYFTNDNGTITVTQDNVKNLINAGLNTVLGDGTTVFQGTLDSFNLNPAITSLEDFADAMGLTTTSAFALIGALDQYDQNRFGFLESLMPESLEGDILRCDRAMADLLETREQLGKAGKVGSDEWDELEDKLKEVEAEYARLGKTAREKVADNISLDAQITAAQQSLEYWQQMIDTYDQAGLQGTNEYVTATADFTQVKNELDDLLNQKYQLGEPTEIEVQVALESVQEDIDTIQSQLDRIGDSGTGVVKLGDVELSVDDAKAKLAELEEEKAEITAYAELDDEDVMSALEEIQDFTIYNKSFSVTMSGYDVTIKRLNNILNLSNQIRNVQSGITSAPRPAGAYGLTQASGSAQADGTAHEQGRWGIRRAQKDVLTGELGQELLVDPHNGTYRTIGDHGAEFVDVPKDAIIFNHRQTEELLRNRRINSRGRALVEGNAYASPFSGSFGTRYDDGGNGDSSSDVEEQISDQLDELKDQLDDLLRNYEHQIFLLERQDQSMRKSDPWTKGTYAERIAYYEKMQGAVSNLANQYRSMGLDDTSEYIQDLQKQWYEYADAIHELREQMVQDILDVVDAASELVDKFQNINDVLHEAADEYASTGGYITIDTYQKLIAIEPQYMQYLKDENGLLIINDEKINEMIAAKTRELALDNALAYVERLRLAKAGQSIEDLNELLYATQGTTNATWELVYAQVAALNLNENQYRAAIHNIDAMRALAENAIEGIGKVSDDTSKALEDMESGVDDILKYVMDMLKQRINDQIDAIEDMKDSYSEFINMKKESLRVSKEEADYQKSIASKQREIVKLQSKIESLNLAAMQGDRKAQAQLAAAQEEMAKLQEDLADQQADHALEAQEDALDKMEEAYHAEKDAEIEILRESISSYQKLYDMAISYIQTHWDTLYEELIGWNTEYGSVLNSEITTAWDNALLAAQRYGDYLTALQKISSDVAAAHNDTVGVSMSFDHTGKQIPTPSAENVSQVNQNVSHMKQNSRDWTAANEDRKSKLEAENREYAAQIGEVLYNDRNALRLGNDGWWYLPDGRRLYEVYSGEYHTGGDVDRLGRDEVFAKLKYGETVLDEETANGLVEQIERIKKMSDVFTGVPSYVSKTAPAEIYKVSGAGTVNNVTNNSNSRSGDLILGDTIINGAAPDAIKQHFKLTEDMKKEIARWLGFRF